MRKFTIQYLWVVGLTALLFSSQVGSLQSGTLSSRAHSCRRCQMAVCCRMAKEADPCVIKRMTCPGPAREIGIPGAALKYVQPPLLRLSNLLAVVDSLPEHLLLLQETFKFSPDPPPPRGALFITR